MADRATVAVYERVAGEYRRRRKPYDPARAERFAAALASPAGTLRLDLGAGAGHYVPLLGRPLVATDVAAAMCAELRAADPDVPVVRHDLEALPFRPGAFGGIWASKCLQHLPADRLPGALAEAHRALAVGGRLDLALFRGERAEVYSEVSDKQDDFPGRLFTWWEPEPLTHLLVGAGFGIDELRSTDRRIDVTASRLRTLTDVVGPGMRLLVCGLNPSVYAADRGVPYARPGNRFWPAALAAGIAGRDRDPWHALAHHGTGFTDLVKRATPNAGDLRPDEYVAGLARLDHLCTLLRPAAVAFCGLTGWRAAVDRTATAGWQPRPVGGSPAYVLPNPSGANAHTDARALADHLHTAYWSAP